MKVLNSKGIASHTGPESCVTHREVRNEALTGELAGQPLSREIFISVQGADAVSVVESNTGRRVSGVLGSNGAKCGAPHFAPLLPNTLVRETGKNRGLAAAATGDVELPWSSQTLPPKSILSRRCSRL